MPKLKDRQTSYTIAFEGWEYDIVVLSILEHIQHLNVSASCVVGSIQASQDHVQDVRELAQALEAMR